MQVHIQCAKIAEAEAYKVTRGMKSNKIKLKNSVDAIIKLGT